MAEGNTHLEWLNSQAPFKIALVVFSGPVRSGFLPPNKATNNLTGFLLPKIDITATATALNWCKPVFLQF